MSENLTENNDILEILEDNADYETAENNSILEILEDDSIIEVMEEEKGPVEEINNLEVELTELKSKKETIEPGQEKYDLAMSIKRLEDQIGKAKSEIDYGDRSFENSFSLVGASEEEFQSIMSANNIPVDQAGTGTGNAVKYVDPKTNEEVYIDLQPFTYDEKIKSAKQIDQLKNSFKSLSNEDLSKNIVSRVGLMDNVYSMNDALDGTNYSVKESFKPGSAVLGFKGTPVYQVYKGEDLVGSYENQNDLSAYFNKNLDDQDINIINDNSVKASSKLAESRKDRLEIEKAKLDKIEVNREFIEGKDFAELTYLTLSNNVNFTEEEAKIVKDYINNFDSRRPTETITERTDVGGFTTREVPKKLTNEEYIKAVKDLSGLPPSIGKKLLNVDLNSVYENGLNQFKKNKLDNKMTTIYETLTKESGDQDLLKLSYSFGKAEEKEYKENIKSYKEKISKQVNDLAVKDVKSQLEKISAIAPADSKINVNTIDSEFVYSIEKPKRKLTKEEEVKFKEAQASLFLLYENQKNNQKDLELEAERLLASIKTFEEKKRGEKISQAELFNVAFKEYGLSDIIKKDFNDATAQLLLAVPTLINSDWAIEQQRKLDAKEKTFETPLTYDQALEQDQGGRFLLRTGAQQAPNMILAIGTAGAGNALGLSKIATQIAVGSQFGVSSGADKFRRLELGKELVETAKSQRKQIQDAYDLGFIDDKKYNNSMLEVNKVIAMNDLTDNQIIGASIATGIIEGTFTSFLGTAPNSLKAIKDFSKGTRTLADYAYSSRLAQFGYAGKELGKRVGAEVLEEEGIFFGDQIVSEGLILGRDMDFSQWDDTAVAAIVMSGAMSGPGVAYSAMANNTAGKKLKENIDEINKEIEGFSLAIKTEQDSEIREILTASMSQKLKDLSSLTNGLEVEMIALGSENQKKLLAFNSVENSILAEAGVKPTDSETTKNEKIQIYRDNLIKEGKKNKAEDFDQKLKSINSEKENILKDVKYERVDEALGERGKEIANHFKRYNNQGYNNKSRSEKLAQVIEKIRSEVVEDNIIKAKSNPVIVERVENLKTKAGKPLSNRSKNKVYAEEGENMLYQQGKAISLAVDVESKGKDIVENIDNLEIKEFKNIEEAYDILEKEVKSGKITNENKLKILKGLKKGGNGFIVGGKYIVKDKQSAKEKLKEGKILQGTMILHEVNHAIDDRIFTTPELKKQYADNVYKHVENQGGVLKVYSDNIIEALENQLFTKEKGKKWKDKSKAFKDEYTKVLQESLYAQEDLLKLEKKEGIADKIEAMLGLNLKVDTPQKAFDYMISNNSAFRKGKISKKTQKRISKAPEIPKNVKSSIKPSSLGFVVDETPAERKKRQDKRNVDVDKVYQDFAKGKTKEEWNEFLDTRRGDSVFGKMLQDYSIDMYAIAINRRAQDPVLATSEAIEPLMNHIRAFDPTKNKDLPGYIGGYLGLKTGTGIERTTKKIQDISLEQEGVRQVAEKQAQKESEPQVEEKLRDKKSFVELDILNDNVKSDINSKILTGLYKLAVKGDLSIDQAINEIESIIEKDISKNLISIFGPKSIVQDSKTKEVIISDTYKQALRVNYKNIIKSIPVDVIKKKYNKLFKLKEVGREDIKKVTEEGKVTNYRKAIFDISEPGLDNFINFFTKGGYTTLRARQKSMVTNIAKELAAVSLFSLNVQEDSLSNLFEGSDTETQEKVVEFVFKNAAKNIKDFLTREVGEQRSMDIVKFSADLNIPQINNFANKTNLIVEKYKELAKPNKEGEYRPTEKQLISALTWHLYAKEEDLAVSGQTFIGKEGLNQINELAKNLRLPLQKMLKNLPKIENIDQAEFLITGIEQEVASINLKKVLQDSGVKLDEKFSWAELNKDADHLIRMRDIGSDANKNYYKKAKDKKQALINIWKWDPNHQATAGANSFISRNQFYPNKKQYVDYDFNQIDPENVKIIYKDNKKFEIESVEIFKETISAKEWGILTKVPAQEATKTVTKNGVKSKVAIPRSKFEEEYDERQEAALSAWNFMNDKLDYLSKNTSKLETASYLYTLAQASMTTMLKAAAPAEYYYVGPSFGAKLRYEHMLPTNYVVTELGKKYIKNEDIDLEKLRKQYKVAIIPIEMDDNFNYLLKDYMPASYTLDMGSDARYYNNTHLGMDNMFPIKSLDPNKQKELPVGQDWVDINNAYIAAKESTIEEFPRSIKPSSDITINTSEVIGYAKTVDEALKVARDPNAPVKKIRVFDFDDTLATTKSDVLFTAPDGTEGRLNAEEFAKQGAQLLEEGYVFDFSEFNKVTKGKPGPLLDIAKKIQATRGTEDVFVLTARAPEAQVAIKEFLDSVGLNIPLKNITGLGNSTGEAKANWLVNKAAEGYNDFYFADDAYQNVKAVKEAMSVLDVKSKVQQAKVKFSSDVNVDFNKIIEQTTGIASEKIYSEAKAKVRGANKGNKKFFIPYSAEDFMGLIYPLLSKGKLGDSQMAWFKQNLLDPYARAQENISADRLQLMEDFKALKKALEVPKDLRKKTDSGFTKEQAVRVYLFNKAGFDVPGISKTDLKELLDLVNSDGILKAFGDQIFNITKGDSYAKPGENWLVGTITTDLIDVLNTVKRAKYLEQSGYTANAELIFSKDNLNKLEAAYGTKYREAMENVLGRMKSGKNRIFSGNRLSNRVLDYINNSTGAIMFFNTRSAVLQTISAINFLNWSFNNPIKAGAAFANQPQYWKDFVELINSDYLVDRRNGLKLNINESEIADAAATSKNKAKAAINYILQKGFLPTQFADSFAIAAGGATFYRNRINDLIKNEGMSEADAKNQAMLEWRETAEVSQQSSDPSKISAQQASDLGRVILAFANTPMQYARIQKRALQDLVNGRGDAKTNVSKIIYYAVVQNLIFNALQSALFSLGFGDDEDDMTEKQLEAYKKDKKKKYLRIANGMLDSQLRGLGLAGATVAVIKNFLTDIYERSGRKRPEYVDSVYELLRVSPPISNKISKIRGAAWEFDSKKRRQEIFDKGFSIDNPAYEAGAKVISATTNIPLDRVYSKVDNISGAMSEDAETWQTVAMLAGWPKWTIMPKEKEVSTFNNGSVKIETSKFKKSKFTKSKFKRSKFKK